MILLSCDFKKCLRLRDTINTCVQYPVNFTYVNVTDKICHQIRSGVIFMFPRSSNSSYINRFSGKQVFTKQSDILIAYCYKS